MLMLDVTISNCLSHTHIFTQTCPLQSYFPSVVWSIDEFRHSRGGYVPLSCYRGDWEPRPRSGCHWLQSRCYSQSEKDRKVQIHLFLCMFVCVSDGNTLLSRFIWPLFSNKQSETWLRWRKRAVSDIWILAQTWCLTCDLIPRQWMMIMMPRKVTA